MQHNGRILRMSFWTLPRSFTLIPAASKDGTQLEANAEALNLKVHGAKGKRPNIPPGYFHLTREHIEFKALGKDGSVKTS